MKTPPFATMTTSMRRALILLPLLFACTAMPDSAEESRPERPVTAAERSAYARTSTSDEVDRFLSGCVAKRPDRLGFHVLGKSVNGRTIPLVLAADPLPENLERARDDGRPVVLVMANIHAGEVEGKEAVQEILREIAFDGLHAELLQKTIVAFVPNYNPDGNDAMDRKNRPDQAGPVEGVGRRPNGAGLDLNRDFLKIAAPETGALIDAVRASNALLVIDCHATNGSFHGYDLTYAGPLHPGADPELLSFVRKDFLPAVRARMAVAGYATFDYGNWVDDKTPAFGWATFEPNPRFGNSYFGMRNRISLLSEAYSHDPFVKRIASTKALVLAGWGEFAERGPSIAALCRKADDRGRTGSEKNLRLPTRGVLAQTGVEPVPVGGVREETDPVTGLVRQWDDDVSVPTPMPVYQHFDGAAFRPVPALGWAVRRPSPQLLAVLDRHGIVYRRILDPERANARVFYVSKTLTSPQPFQGLRLRTFQGRDRAEVVELPPGAIVAPAAQALLRLAFILFEPESEDGLGTWGLLGVERGDDQAEVFEALRIESMAP